jgi:hypothetical protein
MLMHYRNLLALRRRFPALLSGKVESVTVSGRILSFRRKNAQASVLVYANIGQEPAEVLVPDGEILLSTDPQRDCCIATGKLRLGPNEAFIFQLAQEATV